MNLKTLASRYDIVLVGDGSGVNKACGWAVVLINHRDGERRVFLGCISKSTVNVAELIGYLHVLNYLRRKKRSDRPRVLILTDSLVTAQCGNGHYHPKANIELWAALEDFKDDFILDFVHVERCSFPLAQYCDDAAGQARIQLEGELEDIADGLSDLPEDRWFISDEEHSQDDQRS